jgi:hypothetical protein
MRSGVLLLLLALTVVPLFAEAPNRWLEQDVLVEPAGSLADGTALYEIVVEVAVATTCDGLTNLGTIVELAVNGVPASSKAFNLLSTGGDAMRACAEVRPAPGDDDACRNASPCTSFFPSGHGDEFVAACEIDEAFGRPAACRCTSRRAVRFRQVPLVPGDRLTVRAGPSPVATAPESFNADDVLSFSFDGPGPPSCVADGRTVCLQDGRFRVQVRFVDPDGDRGPGWGQATSRQAGYFWFFNESNMEVAFKVLDGRPINGAWWFFAGGLSTVAYDIFVTDTATGETRIWSHEAGAPSSVADTAVFPE